MSVCLRVLVSAVFISFVVYGCNSGRGYSYRVRRGDTLQGIARAHKVKVDDLLKANNMKSSGSLRAGQVLLIPGRSGRFAPPRQAVASKTSKSVKVVRKKKSVIQPSVPLIWPAKGEVVKRFGFDGKERLKGIRIAVPSGGEVRAAAPGKVIYIGNEIDGYGNMIIVRHKGSLATIYALVDKPLVHKGDRVERGQVIGRVLKAATSRRVVHFEVRQGTKAVDPLSVLPSKN